MVRPRGSFQNKQLALEFAETVTLETSSEKSKVARAGTYSLFEVFARCCPWAVRYHTGGARDGLTIQEFNKLLESHDFVKVRKSPPPPGSDASENFADPSNPDYTGAYAFAKLRWRDPLDAEDCAWLVEGRRSMQAMFCEGNEIVGEEEFLASVLEAKLEGDRQLSLSRSETPRSGSPAWSRSSSVSSVSPAGNQSCSCSVNLNAPSRKRGREEEEEEEDCEKRQRREYAAALADRLQHHLRTAVPDFSRWPVDDRFQCTTSLDTMCLPRRPMPTVCQTMHSFAAISFDASPVPSLESC